MDVRDLVVEVRDINLQRVGQIAAYNLPGLKLVDRFNNVGTWEITLPADDPIADELRAAGAGLIVTGETGVIMSGFTVSAVKETTPADTIGVWKIQGVDDSVILGERLAYPTPASADVTAQTIEKDTRSGAASTVMTGFVSANIGASAPVSRQIPYLTVAADPAIGSTVYKTARFRVLGELLAEIGSIDPIGFKVRQSGSSLEFSCYEPLDRTGEIRLDVLNDTLSKSTYGYGAPSVTRAIVGGMGQGTARTFVEVSDTESLAAETLWNRRIETFVDQNNEDDSSALAQAGLEKIVEGGRTATSVSVSPSSDLTMSYGRDWYLGDRVTVVIGSQEVTATVSEIGLTVESDGIRIGATVGDPTGVDFDALITKREQTTPKRLNAAELKESGGGGGAATNGLPVGGTDGQILAKIDATDYNAEWIDNYTSQVKHIVKNSSGSTMPKGSVVYISSADGTNMIATLSDADTEMTSSKTIGLLEQSLATGDHGFVIVEGLLTGTGSAPLDTSGATAGDSVWLSSTAGGFVYDAPPAKPAHSVYLGVVTRSHAVNGEIFVKVQNGFEIEELHNVSITTPADNEGLYYDSATGLWKNGYRSDTPTGSIMATAAATAPSGWLLCDGTAVSRTTYANLFGVIGTTYGVGNGSTTFNLPNLKGRVPVGRDSAQTEFDTLGETGGVKTHTHTPGTFAAAIGAIGGNTGRIGYQAGNTVAGGPTSSTYGISGTIQGAQAFNHYTPVHGVTSDGSSLQPYQVVNYIIKHTAAYSPTDTELATRVGTLEAVAPAGTHEIIPSSISVGTGTASVDSSGLVTFTAVDYVQLNDVFTTNYRNYIMIFERTGGTAQESMSVQLVSGTTPSTAAVYDNNRIYNSTTTAVNNSATLAATAFLTSVTNSTNATYQSVTMELAAPKLARPTGAKWTVTQWTSAAGINANFGNAYHRSNTSYEGIRIKYDSSAASVHTGTVKVYGYN